MKYASSSAVSEPPPPPGFAGGLTVPHIMLGAVIDEAGRVEPVTGLGTDIRLLRPMNWTERLGVPATGKDAQGLGTLLVLALMANPKTCMPSALFA